MIITTEKGTIKSNIPDTFLTDGETLGIEYDLAKGRTKSEFSEISRDEYDELMNAKMEVFFNDY